MSDSPTKISKILDIISRNTSKSIIIFMGSTKSANLITHEINRRFGNIAIAYHSKIESTYIYDDNNNLITYKNGKPKLFGEQSLKKYAIKNMKSRKLKVLVTVNALNEGISIPNINLLITAFDTTNPITHIQRTARAKTYNEKEPEKAMILNVYFDDFEANDTDVLSRDKVKLLKRQAGTGSNSVQVSSLDDLIFL